MELFNLFQFIPYVVAVGFIVVPVLFIVVLIRILNYTETDKSGRKYYRNFFHPGRICPGCGFRVLTKIPTCPSCGRDFSKDGGDKRVHHKDF